MLESICSHVLFSSKKNYLVIVHLNTRALNNIIIQCVRLRHSAATNNIKLYNSNPISSLRAVLGSKDFQADFYTQLSAHPYLHGQPDR